MGDEKKPDPLAPLKRFHVAQQCFVELIGRGIHATEAAKIAFDSSDAFLAEAESRGISVSLDTLMAGAQQVMAAQIAGIGGAPVQVEDGVTLPNGVLGDS